LWVSLLIQPSIIQENYWQNQYILEKIWSSLNKNNIIIKEYSHQILGDLVNLNYPIISGDTLLPNNPVTTKKTMVNREIYFVIATAYSSTPDQTDEDPFITASGTHVYDGIVATNLLPLGTFIKIPELFGDKIFVVEDRMSERYQYHIDIWFPDKELAKSFGVKFVRIEVVS